MDSTSQANTSAANQTTIRSNELEQGVHRLHIAVGELSQLISGREMAGVDHGEVPHKQTQGHKFHASASTDEEPELEDLVNKIANKKVKGSPTKLEDEEEISADDPDFKQAM